MSAVYFGWGKQIFAWARLFLVYAMASLFFVSTGFAQEGTQSTQAVNATAASSLTVVPSPQATGYLCSIVTENTPETLRLQGYWDGMMARHDPEVAFGTKQTSLPAPIRKQWNTLCAKAPKLVWTERLQFVNAFFNNWDSVDDSKNYGQEEYWATAEEFLEKGGGDCEDFALAKYLALRRFGWPEQDMWLLLLQERGKDAHHAVLAVRKGDRIFILDNLSRPAYLLIPESTLVKGYVPMYAINALGLWKFTQPAGK